MRTSSTLLATILALGASSASSQEIALKSGESADLSAVYWIANCKSTLKNFAGVDVLGGPASVKASLREEEVFARRQNCPDKIPGATLVLSVGDVSEPFDGTVRLRVQYNTIDGLKQSIHTVKLILLQGSR